VVSKLLIS